MRVVRVVGLVLVLATTAAPAFAQGVENFRTVYFSFGTGVGLSGNVTEEAAGKIGGNPATIVQQAFSNHYSDGMRYKFGGSYGLSYNREVFASFGFGRFNATERIIGSIAGYPLYGRFSNAKAYDLEGGYRYYFLPEGPLRTYVAGVAGLRFMQEVNSTLRVVELGLTFADRPYFGSSTLFVFGGDSGITYDVAEHVAIGGELSLRYTPKPAQVALELGSGFENINDTGSRWSIPINVFVIYRF